MCRTNTLESEEEHRDRDFKVAEVKRRNGADGECWSGTCESDVTWTRIVARFEWQTPLLIGLRQVRFPQTECSG